jgi:hypothetical protein
MQCLLEKFCSFLSPNIASKYTTSKLQQKLLNYFGNAIIVDRLFFDWYSVWFHVEKVVRYAWRVIQCIFHEIVNWLN